MIPKFSEFINEKKNLNKKDWIKIPRTNLYISDLGKIKSNKRKITFTLENGESVSEIIKLGFYTTLYQEFMNFETLSDVNQKGLDLEKMAYDIITTFNLNKTNINKIKFEFEEEIQPIIYKDSDKRREKDYPFYKNGETVNGIKVVWMDLDQTLTDSEKEIKKTLKKIQKENPNREFMIVKNPYLKDDGEPDYENYQYMVVEVVVD